MWLFAAAPLLALLLLEPLSAASMRSDRLAQLRKETVDMFYHGYSNYMRHAFPEDELRPVTCAPLTRDRHDPSRFGLNDALGNYSLTLIDSLSTLAILAGGPRDGSYTGPQALRDFQRGIAEFVHHYGDGRSGPSATGIRATGFDLDSKVQVFETVIRGVGGLLSAHLFAIGELPIPGYHPRPAARRQKCHVNVDGGGGGDDDDDDDGDDGDDPLELDPIPWPDGFSYDGQLLRLALDLAQRLLPAFYTPTGIPYPRVNLRSGIPFYVNSPLHGDAGSNERNGPAEITETCSAGAGSLTLEFTVLSRLTGDARFEQAAKRAFWEVWRRRSDIGLIGNGIDAEHGVWIGPHAGIGAGMDSFFEYALKSHILLSGHEMPNASSSSSSSSSSSASRRRWSRHRAAAGWLDPNSLHEPLPAEMHSSEAFLQAWHEAHASVKRHLYTDRSHYPYYSNSHRATGQPYTMWIDSLGAFYPGLLALAGEVEEAIEANLVYTALWTRYSALPERWSIRENNVEAGIGWWPGRPEFIESTYHIYRATRDPWYLHVGEMVLKDIRRRCFAPCGWAGLQDVRTGEKQDRMESFFLGETTKYMYLLFDPEHPLNSLDAAYVFTTEGHPLVLPRRRHHDAHHDRSQGSRQPSRSGKGRQVAVYSHDNGGFTKTCPAPPRADDSLTGSATAARPQLFGASRFTDLYRTPNMHGPVEAFEAEDEGGGGRVTRFRATSNHSIFPWTLPLNMLPVNGTCAAPATRIMSAIEFPARDAAGALASRLGASLAWYSRAGPVVRSLDGLKLQLERRHSEAWDGPVWTITHVGATMLGRHESVFFHAEHVRHLMDEAFTCLRREDAVEMELLVAVRPDNGSRSTSSASSSAATPFPSSGSPIPPESLLRHFLRAVSSVFEPSHTVLPPPGAGAGASSASTSQEEARVQGEEPAVPRASILSFYAHTPLGAGAVPLPSQRDTPVEDSPSYDALRPAANFPWSTIYLGGYACAAPLPTSAPRQHHLIVLRRGGCPFVHKLNNIPSFGRDASALQLVVVVDEASSSASEHDDGEEDDAGLDRPLLSTQQLTPNGGPRLHGVPMVLVRGRRGDYERFGNAIAAGMRRKYRIHSQGLLIANAVVM
ncbi:hypothetical protein XA68_16342 [Ophiocordyceps unilateralis]|uniref:alpha-1,2-Mannosidase n=1 Tax=Ophiocordyceps unilateralis TaxID=268505 RepID=A0A2A9P542_OPHUN|nr:hypothetical protein XA68_16342 [Ophiocordyceps unilateralis]